MKKISRKEVIRYIGGLAVTPLVPNFLLAEKPENYISDENNSREQQGIPYSTRTILEPFEYSGVRSGDSNINRQIEYIKEFYLNIPNDDLLKGFRKRVNLPTYGARDLKDWYSGDVYHIFGQLLSSYSRLYAVTGDEDCKAKTTALIDGWAACIEPDGYFYYTRKPNARHYIYDKMVGGLVDAYIFTKNDKALIHLNTITDWALKNLDKKHSFVNVEWYTLSENLYRAYEVTNDRKYFDFAQHWEYPEYWDLLEKRISIFTRKVSYHAYSHLNTLSGAAMAYMLKGDRHYLEILKNAYDFFQDEQCFATGGVGPNERLLPKDEIIESIKNMHDNFETQCGSWAVFKLCRYLMMFTGDARYGDWIEKLIYNGAGANIPISPDGKVFYYSDYNLREGQKRTMYRSWVCCNGTISQVIAEFSHLIYFHNKNGIFINLYISSKVMWDGVELIQETNFPEENETRFRIRDVSGRARKFTLNFRKPGWLSSGSVIRINGRAAKPVLKNNWLTLSRSWRDGDEITLSLPAELAVSRLDRTKEYPACIVYGPVVMAVRSGEMYPVQLLKKPNPFDDFVPVKGERLTWHVKNQGDLLIRPFSAYKESERYILYVDPGVRNRVLNEKLRIEGKWDRWRGCEFYYTTEKGASISTDFEGTGIRLYLNGSREAGKCQILIDEKLVEIVDQYDPSVAQISTDPRIFTKDYNGLKAGKHVVTLKVLGEKREQSQNTYVNFYWYEIL